MGELVYKPRKIYIREDCREYPLVERILKKLRRTPVEYITDEEFLLQSIRETKDPISEGKSLLLVTRQKGAFVKPCPCTPDYVGCNYYVINLDLNCPLNCSYCILQNYLSNPLITLYANTEDLWKELDEFLLRNDRPLRIGTGELGDSLALDHLTGRSHELIDYFKKHPKALFELKTKSINIDEIIDREPAENIIVAWSLNAYRIAGTEEKGAPAVEQRIEAARRLVRRGYRVAFHFDPLILFSGWEEGYAEVIKQLLDRIDHSRIAWISLGSLRFPPSLKQTIARRFPQSRIIYEEMVQGKDGKLRYFKPRRKVLFHAILDLFRNNGGGDIPFYFCMEGQDMWVECLQIKIKGKEEVERLLSLP
jgi:spore photoproduct lyase